MEIKSVTLQTNKLKEMRDFYVDVFGFPLLTEDEHYFRIEAGSSEIEFTSKNVKGNPYYHFALNIFSNKFKEAKAWVEERVALSQWKGEDEAYFQFLDAHAFYFNDPSGNIVEFIARHTQAEKGEGPFSIDGVLGIGEMGLTVTDAVAAGERLMELGINGRDNDPLSATTLNFMGEKSKGVFILLNQPGRQWLFSDKISAIYPIEITTSTGIKMAVNDEHEFEVRRVANSYS